MVLNLIFNRMGDLFVMKDSGNEQKQKKKKI